VQQVLKRVRGELATTPMRPLRVRDLRFSGAVTTPLPAIAAATATRDDPPRAPAVSEPPAAEQPAAADEPAARDSRWSTVRRDANARAESRRTLWILLAALAVAAGALVV